MQRFLTETSMAPLSLVLITPARNEEAHLERTAECVVSQTVRPLRWVIVNDGSMDRTAAIVDRYVSRFPWIRRVDMPAHRDRSFAAKVHSFNAGYAIVRDLPYDVIGNLDADIEFPADYFEFLLGQFESNPGLGVAGTVFQEEHYDSSRDSFEGLNHVAGGCQLFRRQCFEQIGGYVPNRAGGIDWIAVTTARMLGWQTRSFRDRFFFHHRSLGTAQRGALAALFSYGEKDYYLGNHPLWEVCRVAYRLAKTPIVAGGAAVGAGYLWASIRRIPRAVSPQLMRFHRQEQLRKLRTIASAALRMERIDNFDLTGRSASGPADV
jgi:glycosyltransferase involved in cell wall biosynthesis